MSQLTPEQIAAQKQAEADQKRADAEAKAAAKKADQEAKAAQKLADKEAKEQLKLQKKAAKEAETARLKQERLDTAAAKKQAVLDAKAAREQNRMPEQNGVRRPKPDSLCGKAWATADQLSADLGQPVPIASLLESTTAQGLNEGNVKAEYARWRKFHGVTGRVTLPKPAAETTTETPA